MTTPAKESHTDAPSALRRRNVVRAGVVAWTVPVVSVAAAAPAFACSGALSVGGTGNYAAGNPTVVQFSLTVANSGQTVNGEVTMTLVVPAAAGHTAAPTFSTLTGLTKSGTAVEAPTQVWTQTYTRPSMANGSQSVSGTITFTDPATTPYARWNGMPFTLGGSIGAANVCSAQFTGIGIAALPATLAVTPSLTSTGNENAFVDRYQHAAQAIGNNRRYFGATTVGLSGNSSITAITATATMTKNTGGRWLNEPRIAVLHADWQADGTAHTGTHWVFNFKTIAAAFAPTTNSGPGPIGPQTRTSFTTSTQPYNAPAAQFNVLFWPAENAVDNNDGNQAKFIGTITFATTSAGQAVTMPTYTRSDFNTNSND